MSGSKNFAGPLIAILTALFCTAMVEFYFRIFAPFPDPFATRKSVNQYIRSEMPPNYRVHIQIEQGLPGVQGVSLFTTNNMGFRGDHLSMPKPINEFRIFMVGGSTTQCFGLDDSQAIHSVLQSELTKHAPNQSTVKVYAAAQSGDRSDDHISMIVHRLVHLDPDMIIVFSGFNDLLAATYNFDYLHMGKHSRMRLTGPVLAAMVATEFQTPRGLYYIINGQAPRNEREVFEEVRLKTNYKEKVKVASSVPYQDARPRMDLAHYASNLETIAGVARAHGIRLIFMTQQTTWNSSVDPRTKDWHWLLYRGEGMKYREDVMDEAMESYNDVTRQVGAKLSVPLYDLTRMVPKSLEFFYDDVHFNVRGARLAGTGLASFILESGIPPFSQPSD